MSLIRNFSEYEIICEALNALENVANQENRQPGGSLYSILSEMTRSYDSGLTAEDSFKALNDKPTIVNDVQVNGTSAVLNGVANIPIASNTAYSEKIKPGVVGVSSAIYGIEINEGVLRIKAPSEAAIDQRNTWSWRPYNALTLDKIDYAVKVSMCDKQAAAWTEAEQAAAKERMGVTDHKVVRL